MFGAQSSGSLFGAPSSGGSLFGGTGGLPGAGQSPLLTGTSQPGGLFGGNAASGSLFGTPASSGALFGTPGASSSGSLFGTPAASSGGGLFGAPATSSGGGIFGAPAASTGGGLFGAPAASSGGGLFGAPAASTGGGLFGAPTQGSSLFGTSSPSMFNTAASSGGLFGSPAPSAGLFGGASSISMFGGLAQSSTSLFAANTAVSPWGALPSMAQPAATGLPPGQDPAHFHAEQAAIKNGLEHVRPANIDQAQWEAALARAGGADNRDGLWPVAVHGVQQLKAHHDAQQEALQDNRNCLAELRAVAHATRQGVGSGNVLQQRSERLLEQHSRLSHLLLQTIRLVDTLSARIVSSTDCRSMDITLEDVGQQIAQIEAHLAPNNVQGLHHQVDMLRSQMQARSGLLRPGCVQGLVAGSGTATAAGLDDSTMKQAGHILQEHNKGIKRMLVHLDKVERDIAVVTPN